MKLVFLMGESSSGKDKILTELKKRIPSLHVCVSHTTRPMRDGEVDGREYFFLNSNDEFYEMDSQGLFLEKTEYQTDQGLWLYGLTKQGLKEDAVNIVIINPHGLYQLLESDIKDNIFGFYITADFEERFFRYLNRDNMTTKQKAELVDRFVRDENDFRNFKNGSEDVKCLLVGMQNNTEDDFYKNMKTITTVVGAHNE